MQVLKRMLVAVAMCWIFSETLGFLFAIYWDRHFHFEVLLIPAAYVAPTVFSTIIAVFIVPVAFWSLGNGVRKHCIYGPVLWVLLAFYEIVAPPVYNLVGVIMFAIIGLVILRLISRGAGGPVIAPEERRLPVSG
jgi:lysylphosphatidylglycerol synthetase-like protein (DUF2156 family)